MEKFKLDINDIKLNKKDENSIWSCISGLRDNRVSTEFYFNIYKELRLRLGIDSEPILETEHRGHCNVDFYFEVFENCFYQGTMRDKLGLIEIFLNSFLSVLLFCVSKKIESVYYNFEIPDDMTFEYLDACLRDSEKFSFMDFNKFIFEGNEAILSINKILDKNKVKYSLINKTELTELPEKVSDYVKRYKSIEDEENIVVFIRKTDEFSFEYLVEPTINLTNSLAFKSANEEFLRGLDSFKKGNYIDCVNGVTSSLESTIKIIFEYKGYKYKGNEQLSDLTDILFKNGFFDFYTDRQKEDMKLTLKKNIGFIRNTATSHGNGPIKKSVEGHTAKYVINMGASLILYLIEIYEDTK